MLPSRSPENGTDLSFFSSTATEALKVKECVREGVEVPRDKEPRWNSLVGFGSGLGPWFGAEQRLSQMLGRARTGTVMERRPASG